MADVVGGVRDRVDLHFHTECSGDSYMPLFAVLPMAVRLGLRVVAKADHDSVSGCEDLAKAARDLPVEYIPAVELSAVGEQGETWHILGYWIDYTDPELLAACEREKAYGRLKLRVRLRAWIDSGGPRIADPEGLLQAVAARRPAGEVSLKQVYDHLVGLDCFETVAEAQADLEARTAGWRPPAHSPPDCAAVIDRIHRAGGVAVIAHPPRSREAFVEHLVRIGADGIECHNVKVHDAAEQAAWRDFCSRHDLAYTGGTDWHGSVEHWNIHVMTRTGYDAVESLQRAYRNRFGRQP